ncbi:MAG: eukaryotic-like serine/threonine-protein kinase [Acidimicrobiaceae bacterium]|nr:eukaryotic-like serine/threonine-protein kinase [Acidimicrobiaceae bacterium]
MATSRIVEHVGRVLIDRYRLTRPLGTGASAHVYVAEDVTLRRRVAVKLLHPGLADDEAFLRRFQAEARVVAALRHPNIVRVYDWGDDHGSPFLVMELLEGGSLRSLLDRGQLLSPAQAARVGIEAARALDYAHRRGLVHRDIKSANLLFDEDGQVSVADFGLARALAEATWTEPVGAMLGTARYAAPEQIGGGPLDGKADVYALALVLVEAVTGKVPFAADTTIGTLMARVDRDLPVPDELGPLTAAIAAAGTAQPAQRVDAAAFAAALTSAARQLPAPAALTLAAVEVDATRIDEDPDLTQLPFGSKLFDAERVERADRPPVSGERTTAAVAPPPRRPLPTSGPAPKPARRSPPRRRKRWLLALAIVLAVAGVGAGALAWTRASKPSHPVPSVVNLTPAAAEAALGRLHFRLRTSQTFDEQVLKGLIIRQGEPVNRMLREGSTVPVVVSLGPPPVAVPDLAGLTQTDATNRLIGAGLKLGNVSGRYDNANKGVVLSWSGQGGQLPKGSAVDLVVSQGPPVVAVPSIGSGSFAAAQSALAAANLKAVEKDVFSNTVAKGQVISTSPGAATSVQVGSTVTVTVSKGPDLVGVTDVRGQSVVAATNALQAAGFNVTGVTGNPTRNVTRTSPASNAQVLRGSSVTLFTG